MPQLDFTTFSPQLVWLAITFGILYFAMARFALPRISEILEERQNRIDGDLEQAEKLKLESQNLEENYETMTATARAEASSYLKLEREKIQARINEKQANMTAEINQKIADAENRIAEARQKAMQDIEEIASEVCITIVTKLSSQKISNATVKKAIQMETGKLSS